MKAAEQGHANAAYNVGVSFASGTGTAQDLREAYFWILIAAALGQPNAPNARDQIGARLSEAERAEVLDKARKWQPTVTPSPLMRPG